MEAKVRCCSVFHHIDSAAGLTLIVEDPGCDETYEEAQRHDTQREQQLPLSLFGVGPAHRTSATEESHLSTGCTETHAHTQEDSHTHIHTNQQRSETCVLLRQLSETKMSNEWKKTINLLSYSFSDFQFQFWSKNTISPTYLVKVIDLCIIPSLLKEWYNCSNNVFCIRTEKRNFDMELISPFFFCIPSFRLQCTTYTGHEQLRPHRGLSQSITQAKVVTKALEPVGSFVRPLHIKIFVWICEKKCFLKDFFSEGLLPEFHYCLWTLVGLGAHAYPGEVNYRWSVRKDLT